MQPKLAALALVAALATGIPAVAIALDGAFPGMGADHEGHGDHAHDHASHDHAFERTQWPPAQGTIPGSPEGLTELSNLRILDGKTLKTFLAEGLITGNGTFEDPYVIEGLHVRNVLELKDTTDHYVVRENFVAGELRLNWNGDQVHVHHNYVRDLRVNQNNERMEDATAGLIEFNKFGIVGQIRHYDGVFRANTVGPAPAGMFSDVVDDLGRSIPWIVERQVLNIDGFAGAVFEDNDIHGYTRLQLHGHHHSSCHDCHSHNHADPGKTGMHDHTLRYHEVDFINNRITVDGGVAFRYDDARHRGDDRTARSDPDESLNDPHEHRTLVTIAGNEIRGGPLVVDVFNAHDNNHHGENPGTLILRGNVVEYEVRDRSLGIRGLTDGGAAGILVYATKEADVLIEENTVRLTNAKQESVIERLPVLGESSLAPTPSAGLQLEGLNDARVHVTGNTFEGTDVGILAERMTEDVTWHVHGNLFIDVGDDVRYDERSVANAPNEEA